jgi:hypothetical protein
VEGYKSEYLRSRSWKIFQGLSSKHFKYLVRSNLESHKNMIHLIFKGRDFASNHGKSYNIPPKKISREEQLHNAIQKGTITDRDVADIKKDGSLLRELDRTANEKKRRLDNHPASHYFGKGTFDGIDSDGNLYRDIQLDSPDLAK